MLRRFLLYFSLCWLGTTVVNAQDNTHNPSFEEVISLRRPGAPVISPDGKHVLFTMRSTDWQNNRYDTEIWLSKDGQTPFQLTNTPDGPSYSPQWSPDGQWITFLAKRGEKTQLHVIRLAGGEARAISDAKEGVNSYELSPDGRRVAFNMSQPDGKVDKSRKERYGAYEVDDEEVYRKTSPMTYINEASTPTLIQHGEFDRRVPIPNAYELLQGLRDVGVPAKLVVYKGFGHGITKPKERLAATWHNWQWFNRYLWGEEVDIPMGTGK